MKCLTIAALTVFSILVVMNGLGSCGSMPSCQEQIKDATAAYRHCVKTVFIHRQTQCEVDYEKVRSAVLAETVAEKDEAIFNEFQVTSCDQLTNPQLESVGGCQNPGCSL